MKNFLKRGSLCGILFLTTASQFLLAQSPNVSASKTDVFTPNGAGKLLPGAPVQYRTTINNAGTGTASGLNFADAVPSNTTLVSGSVNVSPLANNDAYTAVVNTQLAAGSPTVLSGPVATSTTKATDNDREFLSDSFTISTFDSTSANGGSVAMVTSGVNIGSFTYQPAAGFVGTDSFTYTLRDDGTDSTTNNSDDLTGIGTVSITVVEADSVASGTQKIWYLDSSYAGANGSENGTSSRPFNSLADVTAATGPDAIGDTIFLSAATAYSGGVTLLASQTLWGNNTALVINSINLAPASTQPVVTNASGAGITLATNNSIRGLAVGDTSTVDISGDAVGNLTISNTTCNGTGGIITVGTSGVLAVNIAEGSTTSAASGISLTGCSGNFSAGTTGSIAGVTGTEINLSGGSATFTYSGAITSATNNSISIANRTGGTATFAGLVNITGGSGISLTNNSGSTLTFTGGITANTGASAAFTATGGGTVNVTGTANTLTTTTATALNVANTTIGASGLNFRSISSNGSPSGIILNTTGTSGGLAVTGDGGGTNNGSGGTIQNCTGSGVMLTSTLNPSLNFMNITASADDGVSGLSVAGFSMNRSNVTNNGNAVNTDDNVDFGGSGLADSNTGITGSLVLTNSSFTGGHNNQIGVRNNSGTASITMTGCTVTGRIAENNNNDGVLIQAQGISTITASIQSSNFSANKGDHFQAAGSNSGNLNVTFKNNTLTGGHSTALGQGITINAATGVPGYNGIVNYDIDGNTINGAVGVAIAVVQGTSASTALFNGFVRNNLIGTTGVPLSGSSTTHGMLIEARGNGTHTSAITGNTIRRCADRGIGIAAGDGSAIFNLTITGNTITELSDTNNTNGTAREAIEFNIGITSTNVFGVNDAPLVRVNLSSNTLAGGTFKNGDIRMRKRQRARIELPSYGGTSNDTAAVISYLQANNAGTTASCSFTEDVGAVVTTDGYFPTVGSVPSPTAPLVPMPLLFSENLLQSSEMRGNTASEPLPASSPAIAEVPAEIAHTISHLTTADLAPLVAEARARWQATGLTAAQQAALSNLRFEISELSTLHLGQATGHLIQISPTAAGNEWFIDPTPADDSEFSNLESQISNADGRVDLLTTLIHEMGHALGLPDRYDLSSQRNIMYGHLTRGERRLPAAGEAAHAVPFSDETHRFLGATIVIGDLPPGKSVTIVGTVLVNNPANTQLITSQGTVTGSNIAAVLTDDPAAGGTTDPTTTPVERPDSAVVSLNRLANSPINTATVTWQLVLDQPVSNLVSGNFTLVNSGLTSSPAITNVTATTAEPATTWNITVSTGTGNGSLGLNLANDTSLSHDITNQPFTGQVYTVDKVVPSLTSIVRLTPLTQNTNADTLTFRATFSENVTGLNDADFSPTGSTAAISSVTGTGPYDITLSGGDLASFDGTVGINLAAGQNITDAAGNALPATEPATDETYILDNSVPTVVITSTTANPAPNAVIPVTVTFSETVTGFDLSDITVAGGSKSNFLGGGASYSFNLTPSGPGVTVTANIAASAAQDGAGNNNTAATQFTRTITDAVSIAATTATAAEGATTGLYTFTRQNTTGDLTTSFQLDASSTATAATDFNLTSTVTLTFSPGTGAGTIVIPNGQLSATVTLTALAETPNPAEVAETARLNVVAASGYFVGSPANATVTINANSFLVTTTANAGEGSLRQALLNANAIGGADTITFSDGTGGSVNFTDTTPEIIDLATVLPDLQSYITISGTGADKLTIRRPAASPLFRIFNVNNIVDVNLTGLTITGGNSNNNPGGGILNSGNLKVTACAIIGNTSGTGSGGGICASSNRLTVLNSTISGNNAVQGGGVASFADFPPFTASSGVTILANTTLSGNTVTGTFARGGGFYNGSGLSYLVNCTITGNSAPASSGSPTPTGGGGVATGGHETRFANTLCVGNTAGDVDFVNSSTNSNTSLGGNLIGTGNSSANFTGQTTTAAANTLLNTALANNGGPTQTHALISGSPALNAGSNANAINPVDALFGDSNDVALTLDQRGTGFTRTIGTVDIGAFELQKAVSIADLAAISEANSGTTSFTFTITRTGDTTGDVNMTYAVSGAAVNAADFGGTLPTGTATIADGSATGTVTIPVSGDLTVEPNEAFTVILSAPDNGYVISGAPATSTINNDDSAVLDLAKITDGIESTTPTPGKFRLNQTAASSTDTTVAYTISGTATSGTDFTALNGTATILAGNTFVDIDVTVLNEGTTLEPTETVIATLNTVTSVNNVTLGTLISATLDITDDDTATVTLAKVNDAAEPATNGLFRVTQTAQSTTDTIVTYTLTGTAGSNTDYTALTGSVTISAGQTTADISVPVLDETLVEATETVIATISNVTSTNAVTQGSPNAATLDLLDNDTAAVSIARVNDGAETNSPVAALFRVSQTAQSSSATTVSYTVSGSASSGNDFSALSGSITIPAGQTAADIRVTVLNDAIVEATETITVTLTGFTARDPDIMLNGTPSATAAIVDVTDNDLATVSLAKISDGIESATPTNALFRVTQSAVSSTDTVVNYSVGGTATSGSDFTALSGSVTILAGQTSANIAITVLDENVVEPTETVSLTLTGFSSADPEISLLAPLTASADITDSDTSVITLAVLSNNKSEGTGAGSNDLTFSATLSNPVQGGFTIAYATNNGTATIADGDYIDNDGSLNFTGAASESKTFIVGITQDSINELDETFTVALGSITNTLLTASISTANSPLIYTISDDDALTVSIAATDSNADENTAATGTYRITRNSIIGTTTVNLAIDLSSTATATDWTQTGATFSSLAPNGAGTIAIPDGQSFVEISLTPTADLHAEAAESVRLNITADANYTVGSPANATVTIGQNDFVVINTNDAGEGTLRQAVLNANAIVGDDTITFDSTDFATAKTVTLTSGQIAISSNVIVQGTGAKLLTIDGNANSRIFNINTNVNATLANLTVTNGKHATSWGGAINVIGGSNVTLDRCVVSNSTSQTQGGGIYVSNATLRINSSTISGNTSTTLGGGAIATGFSTTNATVNLTNSTISGNSGPNGGAMLFGSNAVATLNHTTITNNITSGSGAAVDAAGGSIFVANSLIAGNVDNAAKPDVTGAFISSGGNLIGNIGTATGFTGTNDLSGTAVSPRDPALGPLSDNGGITLTHALLNNSPAINNGLVANLPKDNFDQRGTPNLRQRGPAPDSGAFEAFAFEPILTTTTTDEDTLSSSGLIITANTADGDLTTHYKITNILNGTLYQNDGISSIAPGAFITKAQGAAGLKFLPSPNFHSLNTTAFGFTAQAAVSAADADVRGTLQSTLITVNSINDVPTVVPPGLPDQTLVIGGNITIVLPDTFTDLDGDKLTYSVLTNSDSSKASAVITGSELTLQGLDNGFIEITVLANDGLGGTVTESFNLRVGTAALTTFQPIKKNIKAKRKDGLFHISVRVTNTTPLPVSGIRLHVDFSKYRAKHPTLRLENASSPSKINNVYLDYIGPVAVDESVVLKLEFYTRNRKFPKIFSPDYRVETLDDLIEPPMELAAHFIYPSASTASSIVPTLPLSGSRPAVMEGGSVQLTFPVIVGRWYCVSYSSDFKTWTDCPTPVQATSTTLHWTDSGPPSTDSHPAGEPSRFYRIHEVTAP